MEKNKITVTIAGSTLTLVTDESEEFVRELAQQVDQQMTLLLGPSMRSSARISYLDAALLCSVDYLADKRAAEKKARMLETQLSLCEMNLKSLREEADQYRKAYEDAVSSSGQAVPADPLPEGLSGASVTLEDKIAALEQYLDGRKKDGQPRSRDERIRYIESLLRNNDDRT